jgi:sporulation protein YunB
MKRFKGKNKFITNKNLTIIVLCLIFLNTFFLIKSIGVKITDNMYGICQKVISDVMTNIVNANIKGEVFHKYNINDLITINKKENKVESVDYNLENAYNLLIEIKKSIMKNVTETGDLGYFDASFDNSKIYLKLPFYNYTNNLLLANVGPKIKSRIVILQSISGNMKTKVKTYGINSLQIELYINFTIESSVVIPFKEKDLVNSYDVLVASKVIQGEIPSFYNGLLEKNSDLINLN